MITHKVCRLLDSKISTELQHCHCCPCFDDMAKKQSLDPDPEDEDYPKFGVCENPKSCKEWTLDELVLAAHVGLPIIAASSIRAGDRDIWVFYEKQPLWDDENGEYEEDDDETHTA